MLLWASPSVGDSRCEHINDPMAVWPGTPWPRLPFLCSVAAVGASGSLVMDPGASVAHVLRCVLKKVPSVEWTAFYLAEFCVALRLDSEAVVV